MTQKKEPAAAVAAENAFPTTAGLFKTVALMLRVGWPWRRELFVVLVLGVIWAAVGLVVAGWWSLAVALVLVAGALGWPRWRRLVTDWVRCSTVRRRLVAGMTNTRTANTDGALPRIRRIVTTPVGERVSLKLKPGHAYEFLEMRSELFRAALKARDVRVTRNPNRSDLVTLDVIRRDPLARSQTVAWAHQLATTLSAWDPVHFGASELGAPVYLSLVERALLLAGNRGAGKSGGLNVFLAHAAKSPDAQLLLIDPNRLQLAPYRDRALAFADHDPDSALAVIGLVLDEMDQRLDWMTTLPGAPVALTRELSHAYGVPMWVLIIDELAYHTSVAGTPAQQKAFYNGLRDVVARGRAVGIVPIVATQRPTADLIPTSLRDLFDIRIAYRTMTTTSSDVILGDNFAKRGYSATEIDLDARGVNWLLAGDGDPIRTKTCWITPETRIDLAVTTVPLKPSTPTPTATVVAAVPAPRHPEATP